MLDWKRFEDEVPTERKDILVAQIVKGKWETEKLHNNALMTPEYWVRAREAFLWSHWAYVDPPAQGKTLTHAFTGFFYADRPCIEDGGSAAFVSFDNCEVNPFKGMADGKVRVEMVITSLEET